MGAKKETKEKPLDKMTATELRAVAKEIPGITGVHAMNKAELLSAIKEARGIIDERKKDKSDVRELKKRIKELKAEREKALEANDEKRAGILRKRIIRLKKKTRRAA
ncbi:MAG: Rho termination factor N-terminal domain-containing protein [Deltaproteobacteria bacterium]|nr:Rho termination factor N-terminal domain-containing protein [Deltaproteobacteria bacterium]